MPVEIGQQRLNVTPRHSTQCPGSVAPHIADEQVIRILPHRRAVLRFCALDTEDLCQFYVPAIRRQIADVLPRGGPAARGGPRGERRHDVVEQKNSIFGGLGAPLPRLERFHPLEVESTRPSLHAGFRRLAQQGSIVISEVYRRRVNFEKVEFILLKLVPQQLLQENALAAVPFRNHYDCAGEPNLVRPLLPFARLRALRALRIAPSLRRAGIRHSAAAGTAADSDYSMRGFSCLAGKTSTYPLTLG